MKATLNEIETIVWLLNQEGENFEVVKNFVPRNSINREVYAISGDLEPDKFIQLIGKILINNIKNKSVIHTISTFLTGFEYEYSVDYIYY